MNKEHIDSIIEALGEIYSTIESKAIRHITIQLSSVKAKDITEWRKKQLNAINSLKRSILKDINAMDDKLHSSIRNAVKLTYKKAISGDGLKSDEEFTKEEIEKTTKSLIKSLDKDKKLLVVSATLLFKNNVKQVYSSMSSKRIDLNMQDLTKKIEEVVNGIGVENAPRVPYYSRTNRKQVVRNVRWSSYMEMNVRTTLSHRATEYQYDVSKSNGVIFYLCNFFGNCADDHKDYQGKLYYDKSNLHTIKDEEMKSKVLAFIKEKKLMDVTEVQEKEPFLTTRPNCRHKFKPMTNEEVLTKSVGRLIRENKMRVGNYEEKNYKELQEQRYNERTIKKYKERLDNKQAMLNETTDANSKSMLERDIAKDKALIRKWQKKNKQLVDSNPTLERDYRREDYKRLVKDLGVKYNS